MGRGGANGLGEDGQGEDGRAQIGLNSPTILLCVVYLKCCIFLHWTHVGNERFHINTILMFILILISSVGVVDVNFVWMIYVSINTRNKRIRANNTNRGGNRSHSMGMPANHWTGSTNSNV